MALPEEYRKNLADIIHRQQYGEVVRWRVLGARAVWNWFWLRNLDVGLSQVRDLDLPELELAEDVKFRPKQGRELEQTSNRLCVLYAGPMFNDRGQVWEPLHVSNLYAAAGKNLSEQVPLLERSAGDSYRDEFLRELANGRMDAVGLLGWEKVFHEDNPLTYDDVIAHVAVKSPSKARAYRLAIDAWLSGDAPEMGPADDVGYAKWVGEVFVKCEYLKAGKPPRLIFNALQKDIVLAHMVIIRFERWAKANRLTFKGLVTADRWKPIAALADRLGDDMWVLMLDCVARDGNVTREDLLMFRDFLAMLNMLHEGDQLWLMLTRVGMESKGRWAYLETSVARLHSGVSFTSVINMFISWFGHYVLSKELGLSTSEYGSVAEGDDGAVGVSAVGASRLRNVDLNDVVASIGRKVGKVWKIESWGSLLEGGHPIVGSLVGCSGGRFWSFPGPRLLFRGCAVVGFDLNQPTAAAGRLRARAQALRDRCDGLPIGFMLARHVTALVACLAAKEVRTSEQEYDHRLYGTHVAVVGPPSVDVRLAYEHVTGCSVGLQLQIERLIGSATRAGVWNPDLRWLV